MLSTKAPRPKRSTEKVTCLPRKLSTEGAPAGIDPSLGDITYQDNCHRLIP